MADRVNYLVVYFSRAKKGDFIFLGELVEISYVEEGYLWMVVYVFIMVNQ